MSIAYLNDDPIEYLIARRYPPASNQDRKLFEPSPFSSSALRERQEKVMIYREELEAKSEEELKRLCNEELQKEQYEMQIKHGENHPPTDWQAKYLELQKQNESLQENLNLLKKGILLHPKERLSLLKLVLGMAIDGYGYDLRSLKSPAASTISSGLATCGISIDEDTVRKWLNAAKEEVEVQTEIERN